MAAPDSPSAYRVSFDVTNTSKLAGATVAQLYRSDSERIVPRPKELKGFAKVFLKPGETRHIFIPLTIPLTSPFHFLITTFRRNNGAHTPEQIELRGDVFLPQEIASK